MLRQSGDFIRILQSASELERALATDSAWLIAYDENHNTLLHHVVYASTRNDESYAVDIRAVLQRVPDLDFRGQDNNQNTPLHIAAWHGGVDNTSSLLFPFFIEKAVQSGFDFSILGEMGLTVLQVAAKVRDKLATPSNNNVKTILDRASDPAINQLSAEGATAFYYAVASANFMEADALLTHGANPLLCRHSRYDTIALIKSQIELITVRIAENPQSYVQLDPLLVSYQNLLQSIQRHPFVRQYAEIRKNARILFQGQQQAGTFFAMPDEMLIKIAAHTANSEVYAEQAATKIGMTYFKRPLT
jgi:hypothetical protein